MKKVKIIMATFLFFTISTTACQSAPIEGSPLEPFVEETETAEDTYAYLSPVLLGDENVSISIYLPEGGEKESDLKASSMAHGISVETEVVEEIQGAGQMIEAAYRSELERIEALENVKDIQTSELIEGEGFWMQEIDYAILEEETKYPCMTLLKIDVLDENYILKSIIQIDNTLADENTKEMFREVQEVFGIVLD